MVKYPQLFTPITLAGQFFRNRVFAAPSGYQNVNGDGYLNEGAAAYFERKAKGGVASVASMEGQVDSEYGRAISRHIGLDKPNVFHNLARIAYGVSSYGAVASLELTHVGMFANREFSFYGGETVGVAYGPVEVEQEGRIVRAMDDAFIERTIDKFAAAAFQAKRAGFGMVTVHAGHGWLLHQFLSPITNMRTDQWGGAKIENRARLTREVLKAIRKAVGKNFPIEVRISATEAYPGGYGLDEGIKIAQAIEPYVDLLHCSAGNHEIDEVFAISHPGMFQSAGHNVKYAAEIRKHVSCPIATIGGLSEPEMMEEIIASGTADVVEATRTFLADPDFTAKLRVGKEADARKCIRCLSCFSSEMTHGEPYCTINPETGRETDLKFAIAPPTQTKRVLVIGGGIAGMQAALTCQGRGHEVILCEKKAMLGGVLRCETGVYFKKNMDYYLDQQARFVREANIRVDLNTVADEAYIAGIAPDVIIVAIGSRPLVPSIAGLEQANAFSAESAYLNPDKLGESVLIIGAGLVGVELGLHLLSIGKKLTLIEATDHISDGGNFLHILGLKTEIRRQGLAIVFSASITQIDEGTVTYETEGGEKTKCLADSIVYATGLASLHDEAASYSLLADECYMVGDCFKVANAADANRTAFFTALNIGRV